MLVKKIYTASDLREEFIAFNRDYYSIDGYQAIIDLFEECDCGVPPGPPGMRVSARWNHPAGIIQEL